MSQQGEEENSDIDQPIKRKMSTNKYCTEHPKEINRMYCTDCNSLVCGDCIVGPHQQHSFNKISLATKNKLQELQDFLEKLKNQIQPELLQSAEKIETEYQEYFRCDELIREEINDRIENLKNELDNIRDGLNEEVREKLQNGLEKLESSKLKVKQNLNEVENTIKKCEDKLPQLDSKPDRETLLMIMETKQDLETFESQTEVESVPLPTFLSLGLDESMKMKINNYIDSEAVKEHFNETPRTAVDGYDDDENDDIKNNDDNLDENDDNPEDEKDMTPSKPEISSEDLNPDDLENEETNKIFSNLSHDKAFKPVQRSMQYDDEQEEDTQEDELEPSKHPTVTNIPVRNKRNYLNNKTEEFDRITEEDIDSAKEYPDQDHDNDDPTDNNRQFKSLSRRLGESRYDSDQSNDMNMDMDDLNSQSLQSHNMDENRMYKGITNSNYSRNIETNPNNEDILQEALDILNEEVEDSSIQYDEEDGDDEYDYKIKKKKKGKDHKLKHKNMKEKLNQKHKDDDSENMENNQRKDENIDGRKGDKTDRKTAEQLKHADTRNGEKVEIYQQRKTMQEHKVHQTQVQLEMPVENVHQTQVQPEMSRNKVHQTSVQPEMSRVRNVRKLSNKSEKVINISKTKTSFIGKIDIAKVFGHFDSKCMSVLSDNEVWIGNSSKNKLALIGYNSEILQSVKTDFTFEAIATTQTGELLVTEKSNGLIMKITKQNNVETFADISPFRASCIYMTESNNLLCGLMKQDGEAKVIKMSARGRIALTFQYDERNRKQLFQKPFSITQNKNRDIWVVEDSLCSPVKVIDKNGKFKFTYTGLKDTSTFGKFSPCHVLGVNLNVLISDDNNHLVHLVDQEGQFLCFVIFKDEQIRNPSSLDKDSDGNIWIRCADNKINVVSLY